MHKCCVFAVLVQFCDGRLSYNLFIFNDLILIKAKKTRMNRKKTIY